MNEADPLPSAGEEEDLLAGYFANKSGNELASELSDRFDDWRKHLQETGKLQELRDSYDAYYGIDREGQKSGLKLRRKGRKGEVVKVKANHYASIIRGIVTLITSEAPWLEPKAANTDSKTTAQALIAKGVLEQDLKQRGLAKKLRRRVAHALRYKEGWLAVIWNEWLGKDVEPDPASPDYLERVELDPVTGEPVSVKPKREGDNEFINLTPVDVARDFARADEDHEWLILRYWRSKYNLAARAKLKGDIELAKRILSISPTTDSLDFRLSGFWRAGLTGKKSESDLVPVYHFFHRATDATPKGKEAVFLSGDCLLWENELEYKCIPAFPLVPEEQDDAAEGHSMTFDMLALQEALDAAMSVLLTKHSASTPKLLNPTTSGLKKSDLGLPMVVLDFKGGEENLPRVIQAASVSGDDIQVAALLQKQLETLSGLNSVVRGNPEQAIKDGSGAAYALIHTTAIQAQNALAAANQESMGAIGTCIIENHKAFNDTKRRLEMVAGETGRQYVEEFSGEDLDGVSNVTAETANPVQATPGGKMQLLQFLQSIGLAIDVGRAITYMNTGRWEHTIEDAQNEDMVIRQENEALGRGEIIPPADPSENHVKHIYGHRPKTKDEDPQVQANRDEHVLSHLVAWRNMDPAIAAALNIPAPPMPMMPPGMAPPPGPEGAAPPEGAGPPPGPEGPPPSEPGAAGMPSLPKQPDGQPVPQQTQQAAAQAGIGA